MTAVFEAFVREYKELCIKHQLFIAPSLYDDLGIYPLKAEDMAAVEPSNFQDWTTTAWTDALRGGA